MKIFQQGSGPAAGENVSRLPRPIAEAIPRQPDLCSLPRDRHWPLPPEPAAEHTCLTPPPT
eukprot:1250136-Prymnesium_polylepis.1